MKFNVNKAILFLLALTLIMLSYVAFNIPRGEWVCIAQVCEEWATGNAWVAKHCEVNNDKTDMLCNYIEGGEEKAMYLSELEPNNLKSCNKYSCNTQIYIQQEGG